ncbi:hypothetical protein L1887_09280 [Cichorium endivia]|nr:hypothetical protein L1887_09280 [Cichorium endivia]
MTMMIRPSLLLTCAPPIISRKTTMDPDILRFWDTTCPILIKARLNPVVFNSSCRTLELVLRVSLAFPVHSPFARSFIQVITGFASRIPVEIGIMSNEEEKRCPLCAEEMDWTDQQLKPCKCGYEVCVWCWHHIMDMAEKDATEGRCPACRTPYDKDRIVGLEANFQRVSANSSGRKQKQPKAKQKPNEPKKDLSNVRVIQRKMAYIIGLPLSLADEDLLQRKDYFGQYGKVTKVSLSRTAGGTVQQFVNDTCSVYITYSKEEEAVRCIQSVHGYVLDGRFLRASFGTAKYCHAWLRTMPCNNPACLYLHSIGAEEDSFGKDEIAAVHTRNRVQEIVGAAQYLHKRSGSSLPSPVDQHLNNHNSSPEEPAFSNCQKVELPRSSKHMTTFVDIVGRPCNSGSDKDVNSLTEGRMVNLCKDMSSVCIDKAESSDLVSAKSSFPVKETNITKEESGDQGWEDSIALSQMDFLNSSEVIKNQNGYDWWNMESCSQDGNGVNSYPDEGVKASTCTNDGYSEKRFESLGKSDRVYRSSKAFSNEEIVEHLRRLDDDDTLVNDDENSAAVESSIISNILSMDFDGSDDSVLPGLFERKDGRHASWNFQNSDQSRFSFANQELEKLSILQDSRENQDNFYMPQYHATRVQNLTPPGFSKPPPGFSSSMRTEHVVSATPGSYVKNSLSSNHYRTPSIGNISNSSDDFNDPAIMSVGRGKTSSFEEESKLWLLMQQQQQHQQSASVINHHHNPQFSQTSFMQQHTPQFSSYRDDYYGDLNSRLVDQNQQRYTHTQQQKLANGHEVQQLNSSRSEVERLGLDKLLPGYGEYMFQMPSSGDVYTRVFGM